MINKIRNKRLSLLLTVVMVFSMLPLTAMAGTEDADTADTITAFEALPKDISAQDVEAGTALDGLNLPDSLTATIGGESTTVEGIAWRSESEYDGVSAGTYIFTAVIPDGYTLEDDVEPPAITVTVGERDGYTVTFAIEEDEYGSSALYLTEGIGVTETDLLAGVSATDETGEPVTVTISDMGGLDLSVPQRPAGPAFPPVPYIITFAAVHPVTGEELTVTREAYVTLGAGDIMPLASGTGAIDNPVLWNLSTDGTLIIGSGNNNNYYVVTSSGQTTNTIRVQGGITANITLDGVNIDVSGINDVCAFEVTGNSTVNLTLSGTNTLKSGVNKAGLEVSRYNTLTIAAANDNQSLTSNGGRWSAGIGGSNAASNKRHGGTIIISGGTVNATCGSSGGAGIGGASASTATYGGDGGTVTIHGGRVNATGGNGAGIGGGNANGSNGSGSGGIITITGGTVTAVGGNGAGIGGGGGTVSVSDNGTGGIITITGGTVTTSSVTGAGIGIGRVGTVAGSITTITGGTVNTTSANPQPINDGSTNVYLNTLTVGDPAVGGDTPVTACSMDGVSNYGLNDVVTDTNGKVYFWLEKNDGTATAAFVSVTVDSDIYAAAWARTGTSEIKTLMKSPYTVTFNSHDGSSVNSQTVAFGGLVTKPADPTRTGYTFDGWYTDSMLNTVWDFGSDTVSGDMTLYAKWTDTTVPTGEVKVKNNAYTSFLNTITFGLFFKDMADVTITGADASGIASIEYFKTDTAKTTAELAGVTWMTYSSAFSVNANEKFIIYARITDNAGNATVISSDGVVVYTDSEAIVDGGSFSKASAEDLEVTVAMNGNTVKSITNGSNTLLAGTDYAVDYATDGTITFDNAYLKNLADGTQTFTVTWYPLGETGTAQTGSDTPGTTTITIAVSKSDQDALFITGLGSSYTYGAPAFNLSTLGGSGSGDVTYSSGDLSVAGVSGNTVTIHKAGMFTITATKAADDQYKEASVTSHTVTVSEATPTVTLTGNNATYGQDVSLNVAVSGAGAVPEGTVTFKEGTTVLEANVLLAGGTASLTVTNPIAGNHTYTAEYSGQTGYYTDATGMVGIGVDMAEQATLSITGKPAAVTYGGSGFALGTAGGSGTGIVTFSVPNEDVISITAGGTVTIRGVGTVTVTAQKAGDNNYNPAAATLGITVLPRDIDEVTVMVTGSTVYTGSQLQPVFTVTDGTLAIDTGDYTNTYGANVTVAEGGSITLTGQRNYTGTKTVNFAILKATPPAITFPTAGAVTYDPGRTLTDITLVGGSGDGTFAWQDNTTVPTSNNSGYTVVFTPSDADNYDYTGVTLTETVALTVNKAEQVLTGLPDLVKVYGGDNFTVTPGSNASVENPAITFQSGDTSVVEVDASGKFTIKGDGTATITVTAAETDNYNGATAIFAIKVLADTADLEDVIDAAEDLINGLDDDDIGSGDGQYPQDAVDKLREAIDKARDVASNSNATQAEVDAAKNGLLEAIEDFRNSIIAVDFTALDKAIADAGAIKRGCHTAATWSALQTAFTEGKAVRGTVHVTQAEVDAAAKAINDAIGALKSEYVFTSEFGTFTGFGDLTGRIDAPYAKFVKLLIGGKEVESSNYTVTEGSTVIKLKEAYLKTIANGKYTVTAQFTDGSAMTALTVKVSSTTTRTTTTSGSRAKTGTSAKTGDDSTVWPWLALLGVSVSGIARIALTRRKKLSCIRRGR